MADLATKLKSSREYLDEYRTLSESPDYKRSAPPEQQQSLRDAIARAEQMYQEKASRNEWAEVAQQIARAATQFAGAQAGMKSGSDMSNLQFGPGIDFGARTDRAFREYQQELRNAGALQDQTQQQYAETEKIKQEEYGKKREYMDAALRAAREQEQEAARLRAEQAREGRQRAEETKREKRLTTNQKLRDLENKEEAAIAEARSRQTLVNQMLQSEDLSKKPAERLQEKYGALAAAGNIDLAELKSELEGAEKEDSFLGFKYKTADEEARKRILQQKVAESKNLLESIRAQKAELLGSRPPEEAGAPAASPPAGGGAQSERVRVQDRNGKIGTVPRSQLAQALAEGYTEVK